MKTEYLMKIIKEEINKVLAEMVEPADYLKKQFPDVIEYDKERKLSNLYWTVITIKQWSVDDASEFQEKVGYSPMGYGGPYEFSETKLPQNKFKYTWYCNAAS